MLASGAITPFGLRRGVSLHSTTTPHLIRSRWTVDICARLLLGGPIVFAAFIRWQ